MREANRWRTRKVRSSCCAANEDLPRPRRSAIECSSFLPLEPDTTVTDSNVLIADTPMADTPTGRLVRVATLGGAPGTYTYAVPADLDADVVPGRRVVVPFGPRLRAGIVVSDAREAPEGTLKSIERVLDDGPLVTPEVLRLVIWATEYYASPIGLGLRAALPPGAEIEEAVTPVMTDSGLAALRDPATPTATRRALWAVQAGETQMVDAALSRRLARAGLVRLESAVTARAAPPMVDIAVRVGDRDTDIPTRFGVQHAVWALLVEHERLAVEAITAEVPGARDALKRLERRGLVAIEKVPRTRAAPEAFGATAKPPALTPHQKAALDALLAAVDESGRPDAEPPKPFLLHGVTGSGKTEVYLNLIAEVRRRGRTALVLVPEIALTPQLSGRFRARFGGEVAVLHSGLTERDRLAEWHRVRRGDAPIVVGARSAVFAPIEKPGAIIVDEEHDGSFKQEQGLRYHGRDLAVVRGRFAGAVVVLGSATPSLETLHNANDGRYTRLALPHRVDDSRPMPAVELVDLRGREVERSSDTIAPSHLLSPRLLEALQETVERGEQAIVFLNRRGHSTVVLCRDCGTALSCNHCSVALTWHERGRRLTCHYCNWRRGVPDTCENCESTRLLYAGAGTEKLEDELAAAVPGARVARLDRDTAGSAARLEKLLARFSRHEFDVLVGTQMVAKGHDFPGVTLVCVLLADSGLHQPDFRAAERTAQLLTQVAGRAGRGEKPGRVLVQTFAPEAPSIAALTEHDYAGFAEDELPERKALGYPPFGRLCLIRIDGEKEAEAGRVATILARQIKEARIEGLSLLGPAPAPLERLRGRYRFQVLLKAQRPSTIGQALRAMHGAVHRVPAAVRVSVDVDPVDML